MMYVDVPLVMTHESPRKKPEQYVHEKQALACERLLFYFSRQETETCTSKDNSAERLSRGGGGTPVHYNAKAA